MGEQMTFPNTWEEYERLYGFDDEEQIYTNGSRLIPTFRVKQWLEHLPSAEPEQRYTEEELRVFAHGISLRLLSKRSAQHWRYDKDTATEIEFLERLYDKVSINIQEEGEQNE